MAKVKNNSKKEFDSKPVFNEKYLKSKIKSYNGKINTNFHNNNNNFKKIPRAGSQFICLSITLTDSIFRTGKNYYPQWTILATFPCLLLYSFWASFEHLLTI